MIYSTIAQRLAEWEEGHPAAYLALYRRILGVQEVVWSSLPPTEPSLDPDTAWQRLREGRPILRFQDLPIDWGLLRWAWQEIAAAFATQLGCEEARKIASIANNDLALRRAAKGWYEFSVALTVMAGEHGVSEAWLLFTLGAALQPFLHAQAQASWALVEGAAWGRGQCPLCGGDPDLVYLSDGAATRRLVCSRCDTQWPFAGLGCPCCGNEDQATLGYYANGHDAYKLYACDKCGCYLKCVDLERVPGDGLSPFNRVVTFELDKQARDAGYMPAWPTAALTVIELEPMEVIRA